MIRSKGASLPHIQREKLHKSKIGHHMALQKSHSQALGQDVLIFKGKGFHKHLSSTRLQDLAGILPKEVKEVDSEENNYTKEGR